MFCGGWPVYSMVVGDESSFRRVLWWWPVCSIATNLWSLLGSLAMVVDITDEVCRMPACFNVFLTSLWYVFGKGSCLVFQPYSYWFLSLSHYFSHWHWVELVLALFPALLRGFFH